MFIYLTEKEATQEAWAAGVFDNGFEAVPHAWGAEIFNHQICFGGKYEDQRIIAVGCSARRLNTVNRLAYGEHH